MTEFALILVAAGKGARAGGAVPKQYQDIAGKPLLRHTLEAFGHADNDAMTHYRTVIVYAAPDKPFLDGVVAEMSAWTAAPIEAVTGGATRTESVKAGLLALAAPHPDYETPPRYVLIHDAARPFVSTRIIADIAEAMQTAPAAVPVLPLADALKHFDGDTLGPDMDRHSLRRVQTPQAFHFTEILSAFKALDAGESFPDDIAVAVNAGLPIAAIDGEERNFKLTYPADFEKAARMLTPNTYTATGTGYDVHRYTDGDSIWLCGIEIPAPFSLLGHSDADAGLHALTDAVLGALAEGDIGDHFPPSDPKWKGASSDKFLAFAADRVTARGGQISHVDVTLICEKPKIKPHRDAMRARISEILDIPITRISVKATTTEKLGFTGREEGLAAMASASVRLPE